MYKTSNYHESKSRGVQPYNRISTDLNRNSTNEIVEYREQTNYVYAQTMLEIINPAVTEAQKIKNRQILDGVLFPSLRTYQVFTDFAQSGLESQKLKPTMDKLSEIDFTNLSGAQRIITLTKEAWIHARDYIDKIDFPRKITGFGTRRKIASLTAFAGFVKETYSYQLRGNKNGRYPEVA